MKKELLDELMSVAWHCYERRNTFVGCLGCEYRKNESCVLHLNGYPADWLRTEDREERRINGQDKTDPK